MQISKEWILFFFLFCCSVSDFRILYQILIVLRVLGSKFSLISMKNNVRRWVRVGKKRGGEVEEGSIGDEKGDRSCIMKCRANLENSSWLKPEGLSFHNI